MIMFKNIKPKHKIYLIYTIIADIMLAKDNIGLIEEDDYPNDKMRFYIPRTIPKRDPGALLSWAIPAANRVLVDLLNKFKKK